MVVSEHDQVVAVVEQGEGQVPVGLPRVPGGRSSAAPAQPGRQAADLEAAVRMDHLEQADTEGAVHDLRHRAVAAVPGDQAVAVGDIDLPAVVGHGQRPVGRFHPDLFVQESSQPEIVVARQVYDPRTAIHQRAQCVQHRVVLAGHDAAVLEPEIEQIAHDVQQPGPAPQAAQEVQQSVSSLFLRRVVFDSQVGVGNEVDGISTHSRYQTRNRPAASGFSGAHRSITLN